MAAASLMNQPPWLIRCSQEMRPGIEARDAALKLILRMRMSSPRGSAKMDKGL